jgi:hypothetical protein
MSFKESSKRGSFAPTCIMVFGHYFGKFLSPNVPLTYYYDNKTGLARGSY